MSKATEYPVMKKQVAVGSILNFNNGQQKHRVEACDGICYGDKGYLLECICIASEVPEMVGEVYHFDDRVFRSYNNNIVVETPKASTCNSITTNKDRAESAYKAVDKFSDSTGLEGEEMQTKITDLLCNLQHLADEQGIDFKECLEQSYRHYENETA